MHDRAYPAARGPRPAARKCDQVDNRHGELVQDPYRWPENRCPNQRWH